MHEEIQYLNLVREILDQGEHRPDRTGTGTYSVFAPQPLKFSLNRDGTPILPLLTTKRVFTRAVIAELLWFIEGSTSSIPLSDAGVKIWDGNGSREFLDSVGLSHREAGDLGPVYGFQWRHFGAEYKDAKTDYTGQGVDQLAEVIDKLKNKPYDRRIIMSAWNPKDLKSMALPPCHMFAQFYVSYPRSKRSHPTTNGQSHGADANGQSEASSTETENNNKPKGHLHCQLYQRSCDMGLGVPFNIASYALLTHMLAHVCDLVPGSLTHVMGDAHVYLDHVEALQTQLEREPREFPELEIAREAGGSIDGWKAEDFVIKGYNPHKSIAMKMSVRIVAMNFHLADTATPVSGVAPGAAPGTASGPASSVPVLVVAAAAASLTLRACTRCVKVGQDCTYPGSSNLSSTPRRTRADPDSFQRKRRSGNLSKVATSPSDPNPTVDYPDFSQPLQLECPINASNISNRWLNSFVPGPDQVPKNYPTRVSAFIFRMLKSYAATAVRGHGNLPYVHHAQLSSPSACQPLLDCLSVVRICERPLPGSESVTTEVVQREMSKLYDQRHRAGGMSLLGVFQSYLTYATVLFFRLGLERDPFLRQAMVNLQELASICSQQGLVCLDHRRGERPAWESWIAAEAKRRTLYTMYLLDSVLSTLDGLPTYLGIELMGLPGPAEKYLWQAVTRQEWVLLYNTHVTDWPGGALRIDELWPAAADLDEATLAQRRDRVDQWLEGVDEFGTMMYAVTSYTHGE